MINRRRAARRAVGFVVIVLGAMVPAVIVTTSTAGPAHACSCASVGSPTDAVSGASGVFFARATEKLSDGMDDIYEFSVSTVFAGDVGARTTVGTPARGNSCGTGYRVGAEYLLFVARARDVRATWQASLCSPGAGGGFDVRAVTEQVYGPGHPPEGPGHGIGRWTRTTAGIPGFVLLFAGLVGLGVVWSGVAHLRRRRRRD